MGLDWFDRGYWDIAKPYQNNINTVKQYLSLQSGYTPIDGTPPLNTVIHRNTSAPYYRMKDEYHDFEQKAITFDQFLDMDIDVIIASIPDHWETYRKLRDQFKPKAKLVCHIGNIGWDSLGMIEQQGVKNLMASTSPFPVLPHINHVFYYQEQPLTPYVPPTQTMRISSYIHLLPALEQYNMYKSNLSAFKFSAYGASSPDGWLPSIKQLYRSMQEDMFVYHVKPYGDGYGWNWHSAFIAGRPILTNFSDYQGKLGGRLFEDMVTGIDLEKRTVQENCELISRLAYTSEYVVMAENAYKRFCDFVDYTDEATRVVRFLENLR